MFFIKQKRTDSHSAGRFGLFQVADVEGGQVLRGQGSHRRGALPRRGAFAGGFWGKKNIQKEAVGGSRKYFSMEKMFFSSKETWCLLTLSVGLASAQQIVTVSIRIWTWGEWNQQQKI